MVKYGINLMLWNDDMTDELLPVLELVRQIGFDGVEMPLFDLELNKWKLWGRRLDDLGLERTANDVIAPQYNPVSPDSAVRKQAFEHMTRVRGLLRGQQVSRYSAGPHRAPCLQRQRSDRRRVAGVSSI